MTTVSNFYGRSNTCVPRIGMERLCSFSEEKLITDITQKKDILQKYGVDVDKFTPEATDFLAEFPLFILKKETTLCHSTNLQHILSYSSFKKELKLGRESLGWWNLYFVGQSKYKGGWFTYETSYGGPNFGINLFYKVQDEIPLLFVPNYRQYVSNAEYFPNVETKELFEGQQDINDFTGSHLVLGVKNWKNKGYKVIMPEYYADEFAQRIVELGFPGYISCDECEVFMTHSAMRKSMPDRPYKIEFSEDKPETFQSLFDILMNALCQYQDDCPLIVKEGERKRYSMEVLTPEKVESLGISYEEFVKRVQEKKQK